MERQLSEIGIRAALRSEADFLVPLVNRAGEGVPLCIWKQMAAPGKDPWNVGRARIESEETQVSFRHT